MCQIEKINRSQFVNSSEHKADFGLFFDTDIDHSAAVDQI